MAKKALTAVQQQRLQQIRLKFEAWLADRLEERRPISYRFASRLVEAYANSLGITQTAAKQHLLEWGLEKILMLDPTQKPFPPRGTVEGEHLRDLWNRRDLQV